MTKYNYYEINNGVIVTTDGSIRDKAIHEKPVCEVSEECVNDSIFRGVRLKRRVL